MADILELQPAIADPVADHPAHRRIQWASRVLGVLFGAIFAGNVALVVMLATSFLVHVPGLQVSIGRPGMMLTLGPAAIPPGYVVVTNLPLTHRLAHMAMGLVVCPPSLMVFWNLRQLFGLYGRGVVFSEANARHIKRVGLWLSANAVAPLISVSVLSALHVAVDHTWFHGDTISELVLGGVVYVIAQVMQVGRQIEEERGQYI